MLKKIACFLVVVFLFLFSACGGPSAEIVLVTDAAGVEDGARNEDLWEGIRLYAGVHDKTANYMLPTSDTESAYLQAIEQAVNSDAKLVVLSGAAFSFAAETLGAQYPDVQFVLMDASFEAQGAENMHSVQLAKAQAAYLAGYMAVLDGYVDFGFLYESPAESAIEYQLGFVQGVADASEKIGIETNVSLAQAATQERAVQVAETWSEQGVQVVFVHGSEISQPVFDVAEQTGGLCIAAETNENEVSPSVLTSAVNHWPAAAGYILDSYFENSRLDARTTLGVAQNGVGLVLENSRFTTATEEEYNDLVQTLIDEPTTAPTTAFSLEELPLTENITLHIE